MSVHIKALSMCCVLVGLMHTRSIQYVETHGVGGAYFFYTDVDDWFGEHGHVRVLVDT